MRVVSMLPAATEIVAALGLADRLVAVSHECDFPAPVAALPRATRCLQPEGLAPGEIDRWVSETLATRGTLYVLADALLRELRPDVILTQALCDVCAVDHGSVRAFAATLPGSPTVVNLDPRSLDDVLADIERVAVALGEPTRAGPVVSALRARLEAVRRDAAAAGPRPRTVVLEWLDPPYRAGHWTPELVAIAGGDERCGRANEPSTRLPWEDMLAAEPEVLVLAACGFSARRTLEDLPLVRRLPGWATLPAVRAGRVFAVDANAYFARPGPRLVDSAEILAGILHPGAFAGRFPDRGVLRADG